MARIVVSDDFDVDAARDRWNTGQLKCRGKERHDWRGWVVRLHRFQTGTAKNFYEVVERCKDCKNARRREMSTEGFWLNKWRPTYAQDYLVPPGTGKLDPETKAVLRLDEILSRHVEEVDEDDVA